MVLSINTKSSLSTS